jgi:hypothetical protein
MVKTVKLSGGQHYGRYYFTAHAGIQAKAGSGKEYRSADR